MKRDSDGKMPSKKDDLVKMYNDIKYCNGAVMAEYDHLSSIDEFGE